MEFKNLGMTIPNLQPLPPNRICHIYNIHICLKFQQQAHAGQECYNNNNNNKYNICLASNNEKKKTND